METQHYKVFDYINNVISLAEHPENFANCNFALLCEKYPIQVGYNNYLAKVLYISLKGKESAWRLYPDEIKKFGIEYITLTTNSRRRMSDKMGEFFVNGSAEEQEYKEFKYYNYSIELAHRSKPMIDKLREKYSVVAPTIFRGEHQELVLE